MQNSTEIQNEKKLDLKESSMTKEEFRRLMNEAGISSHEKLAKALNICKVTVHIWSQKSKFPKYAKIALESMAIINKYDKIRQIETSLAPKPQTNIDELKAHLQSLKDENSELKKELVFLNSMKKEMRRKFLKN